MQGQQSKDEQIRDKFDKEFSELEKASSTYIDPWGWKGGLFHGVMTIIFGAIAITIGEGSFNVVDLALISFMILSGGFWHSRTTAFLNTAKTGYDMAHRLNLDLLKQVVEALIKVTDKELEIKKLKIELKEVKDERAK